MKEYKNNTCRYMRRKKYPLTRTTKTQNTKSYINKGYKESSEKTLHNVSEDTEDEKSKAEYNACSKEYKLWI